MEPYYQSPDARFYHGHVVDVLAALEPESVQCVVTSPPYFGLRRYQGVEPVVWGGDAACEHVWSDAPTVAIGRNDGGRDIGGRGGNYQGDGPHSSHVNQGRTCSRCGAWYGLLGNEQRVDCLAWARSEPPCPSCFICHLRTVFAGVWRVLRKDGCAWVNLGDSYSGSNGNGYKQTMDSVNRTTGGTENFDLRRLTGRVDTLKPKDLMLAPQRFALAMQADGWTVRSHIVWAKKSPMPESVSDRPTNAHETIWLMSKGAKYFYDPDAVREPHDDVNHPVVNGHFVNPRAAGGVSSDNYQPAHKDGLARENYKQSYREYNPLGRNLRNVWHLGPEPFPDAHFATFPTAIPRRAILASTSEAGCCSSCGAALKREVERTQMVIARSGRGEALGEYGRTAASGTMVKPPTVSTLGFSPQCTCNAPACPCVVLDPFGGSGTTSVVARELGRHSIYIDASAEYLAMAVKRFEAVTPNLIAHQEEPAETLNQLALIE